MCPIIMGGSSSVYYTVYTLLRNLVFFFQCLFKETKYLTKFL